jgi:hypothetical protein
MKLLVGLLLCPWCLAATRTLITLVEAIRPASVQAVPYAGWALLIGFALWVALYFLMPRPVRTYVLAHELTHALWGWLMGARIGKIRVSRKGGSVTLSKTNFLITLAPYFFPFYTMCLVLLLLVASLFFDITPYEAFWLALVGFTWGFHVTFTVSMLMRRQTDITESGRIFSYAFIYLMNVLGICLWIVAAARPTWADFADSLRVECRWVWEQGRDGALALWSGARRWGG